VAWILRIGLVAALLAMAAGVGLACFEGRLTAHAVSLSQIGSMLAHGRPSATMELGVLILLATPMVRVLTLIGVFGRDRDPRFVAAAVAVAALLVVGVFLGRV
jgi:uncharacterized membrane protein